MTMATPAAVEAEIHTIMKDRIEAVHAKDAERLVSHRNATAIQRSHPDRTDRVMKAMLAMKKIDIQRLKDAYEGR
jgi:hypothetical protein